MCKIKANSWPLNAAEAAPAKCRGLPPQLKIDLGGGQALELVLIPAGEFIMGDLAGYVRRTSAGESATKGRSYMATCATTNGQFALFDAAHDSGFLSSFGKDHFNRGRPLNGESTAGGASIVG